MQSGLSARWLLSSRFTLPLGVGSWEIRMCTLEFIAALVEDLVWPLTVVLAIFVFRGPISNLLPFLQRLRYKDFVVEFNKKLDEVETQAAAITGEGAEVRIEDDMLELAQAHPRSAVIDSWLAIEQAIRAVAASREMDADLPRRRSPLAVERELARSGVLKPAVVSLLRDLRSTRKRSSSQTRCSSYARNGPAICLSGVKGGRRPGGTECHSSPGRLTVCRSERRSFPVRFVGRTGLEQTINSPLLSRSEEPLFTHGVEFGFDEVSLRKAFEFAFRPLSANRSYPPFSWAIAAV